MCDTVTAFLFVYHAVIFDVWHPYLVLEPPEHRRERKFETATSPVDRCRLLPPIDFDIATDTGSSLFA